MSKKIIIVTSIILALTGCKDGVSSDRLEAGKKVYATYCQGCHMEDGSGVPDLNAPLISSAYVSGDTKKLVEIVLKGSAAFADHSDRPYHNPMPSMANLSDQQLADVLTYIRNNFKNTGEPVKPADVQAGRGLP